MFGFSTSTLWTHVFPGVQFRVLAATAALRVPMIREMWLWSYCIDASKAVARRALAKRISLALYPGGEREQMMTVRGKHRLYLNSRKGFVKLALEKHASLVPVYVFGETDLFTHSSFLLGPRLWLMKNFGVAVPLIYGAAGLLPHAGPVTAVAGEPLEPPARLAGEGGQPLGTQVEPTQAEVDAFHARYVAALTDLFDRHKAKFGCPDAVLEIQ
jgi:2-acylglycerol O-acyltransferase 2